MTYRITILVASILVVSGLLFYFPHHQHATTQESFTLLDTFKFYLCNEPQIALFPLLAIFFPIIFVIESFFIRLPFTVYQRLFLIVQGIVQLFFSLMSYKYCMAATFGFEDISAIEIFPAYFFIHILEAVFGLWSIILATPIGLKYRGPIRLFTPGRKDFVW